MNIGDTHSGSAKKRGEGRRKLLILFQYINSFSFMIFLAYARKHYPFSLNLTNRVVGGGGVTFS